MKTQNRQSPIIEYRNPGQSFNAPTIRQATKTPPQTVPNGPVAAVKPKQAPGSQPQKKLTGEAFWSQFQGEQLVFQLKSSAIVIGKFEGMQRNWLKIVDAVITGKSNRATVPWVIVEVNSVAHFHPVGVVEQQNPGSANT